MAIFGHRVAGAANEIEKGATRMRSRIVVQAYWLAAWLCVMSLALPGLARADELSRLYRQILRDPQNVELNLRYAALAEERGESRKALAAYERILDAEPDNAIARRRLNRINVDLTPSVTRGRLELGVRYETNVREVPAGRRDDFMGFAKLYINDQRAAFGQRWRTDIDAYTDFHGDISSLDYWRGRVSSGPVFDLGGGATLNIAPSGTIALLDADYFYSEGGVRLLFEQAFGFLDRLDIRGGYRDIDNSFSRTEGFAIDIDAQETFRGIMSRSDALVVQPFFRWRDASGNGMNVLGLPTSFLMGDYLEYGGRLMYFIFPVEDIRLGARFTAYYRDYKQNITAGTAERHDFYISPEAEVLFRDHVCRGCDIRLRYRFEQNFSNDGTQDFINHSIIASGIRRF